METRARNKIAHPRNAVKTSKRRTTAEVQAERAAKAQAKAAQEKARQQSINRAAEFEHADMADEDLVDATPRPLFTPKSSRIRTNPNLIPLEEMSDVEMTYVSDSASFIPPSAEESVANNSGVESDVPPPPIKKQRAQTTKAKGQVTAAMNKVTAKKADKKKGVDESDVEMVSTDVELPQEPKPKKVKTRTRDEINAATKEIQGNKYGDIVRSMSTKQGGKESSGKPGSMATAVTEKRKLRREGAIADMSNQEGTDPNQLSKRLKQNKDKDGNNNDLADTQ
jgi:hypothetical protein